MSRLACHWNFVFHSPLINWGNAAKSSANSLKTVWQCVDSRPLNASFLQENGKTCWKVAKTGPEWEGQAKVYIGIGNPFQLFSTIARCATTLIHCLAAAICFHFHKSFRLFVFWNNVPRLHTASVCNCGYLSAFKVISSHNFSEVTSRQKCLAASQFRTNFS